MFLQETIISVLCVANQPLTHEFVSLYLRGRTDGFVLKGGDATAGALATMYDGVRPDCAIAGTCQRHGNHTYQRVIGPEPCLRRALGTAAHRAPTSFLRRPMNKKGAIVLGTGGDNSNSAQGKFFEGERRLRSCICRALCDPR